MTAGAGGYENTGPKKSFSLWKTLGAFQPHVMARRREWPAWRAITAMRHCAATRNDFLNSMNIHHRLSPAVALSDGRFDQSIVAWRPNPNLGFAAALDFSRPSPITLLFSSLYFTLYLPLYSTFNTPGYSVYPGYLYPGYLSLPLFFGFIITCLTHLIFILHSCLYWLYWGVVTLVITWVTLLIIPLILLYFIIFWG